MKQAYLVSRCVVLWFVSWVHFVIGTFVLLLVAVLIDPRKSDPLQRLFARNIVRLAGVRLHVQKAPSFDPHRTSIFISNHVNLFDPFVLYSSIPQLFRGWELESHFRIPIYGWLMKRFGNIPVADQKTPGSLRRLIQQTKETLDHGTSLVVFPEGKRTLDGRVNRFQEGIFRILRDLEVPIVPVSIVGSYEFNRKGSYMLRPSTIVVHLHDTIETKGMSVSEREALSSRVQQIVSAPVEEALREKENRR
ncbi:MAG: 1-acyl-sn-glycerol-3-phosphate acyltransferase [Acidobacteria bacterium]|nr:1-acyl-sn-glycerol-3-phosphate acyltransferase [Acidobacteriota bacterium]